jgi:hypothetical protein
MGSQMRATDPGKDEESGIVDDQVEVLAAFAWSPADPLIPGGHLPGSGTKAEQGQQAIVGIPYEIANRCSDELPCPEIVELIKELIKESNVASLCCNRESKGSKVAEGLNDSRAGLDGRVVAHTCVATEGIASCGRQAKNPPGMKSQEHIPHGSFLGLSIGLMPLKKRAELACNMCATQIGMGDDELLHGRNILIRPSASTNEDLLTHGAGPCGKPLSLILQGR